MATETSLPLDGGWGWMVALGCSVTNFLQVGTGRTFGVLFLPIQSYFQASSSAVALILSVYNGCRLLGGPIAASVSTNFGCRKTVITGGLLMAAGFIISSFAPNFYFFYFSFSFICGVGACLIFTPSYIIINEYFDKRRGKALALATMGAGVGTLMMAPLNNLLLNTYGLYGTLFINGAIMLHNCVSGTLFRPIETKHKVNMRLYNCNMSEEPVLQPSCEYVQQKHADFGTSCADKMQSNKSFNFILNNMLICKNVRFLLYCLQLFSMSLCISNYLFWIPALSVELGLDSSKGALTVSINGICDVIGRFLGGTLFDLKVLRKWRRLLHSLIGMCMATAVIFTGIASNFYMMAVCAGLHGITEGTFHSQRTSVVADIVPTHFMPSSVGFIMLSEGISVFLGPLISGLIRDVFGSANNIFFMCGTTFGVTSLLVFLDVCLRKKSSLCSVE